MGTPRRGELCSHIHVPPLWGPWEGRVVQPYSFLPTMGTPRTQSLCSHMISPHFGGAYPAVPVAPVVRPAAHPTARKLGDYLGTEAIQLYIHTYLFMYCIPLYTPPPFLLLFLPFGTSSPQKWCTCCPSPIWNGRFMNFVSSLLWALPRRQGLGSTGVVASQDPTPRGGRPPSTDPKMILWNNAFCGLRR